MPSPRSSTRHCLLTLTLATAAALSACGGGDDAVAPSGNAGSTGTAGTPSSSAMLVVSAATPATLNGTLDKLAAQFESNSSNALMTTYNAADPYCRVGAYAMVNSGNMKKYYLEISFDKATGAVGLVKFGDDATFVALATAVGPQTAVAIDKTARRITFTNLGLGDNGGLLKLNGTLEYPTNVDPSNRAACG